MNWIYVFHRIKVLFLENIVLAASDNAYFSIIIKVKTLTLD